MRTVIKLGACFAAGATMIAPRVQADTPNAAAESTQLEEVVVTAQKRSELIQEIPISIEAFSGSNITNAGVTDLTDLARLTPSFQSGEIEGDPLISLRGVSSQVQLSVALLIDGLPVSNLFYFTSGLYDLDRIEVLRGPQGTINGRNATAGSINLVSARPTNDFDGEVSVTGGNYSTLNFDGHVSGPISDVLSGRIAFARNKSDGYVNLSSGFTEGSTDDAGLRLSLDFHPTSSFDALLVTDYWNADRSGSPFVALGGVTPTVPIYTGGVPLPWYNPDQMTSANSFNNGYDKKNIRGVSLHVTWDLSDALALQSITGYRSIGNSTHYSGSGGAEIPVGVFGGADNFSFFHEWDGQYSQELTLTSRGSGPFQWLVGGIFLHEHDSYNENSISPYLGITPPGLKLVTDQGTTSYAGYGQVQYKFTDQLQLTAGGRYTKDQTNIVSPESYPPSFGFLFGQPNTTVTFPATGKDSWTKFTPRVALDYKPTKEALVYVSWARGYEAGGFDSLAQNPLTVPACLGFVPGPCLSLEYQPETVDTYELGTKTTWLDNRIIADLTIYDSKFVNLQNTVYTTEGLEVRSAGRAEIKGAELDFRALITKGLIFTLSGAYTDAKFTEFVTNNNITGQANENLAGNQLPQASKFSFNAGLSHKTQIENVGDLTLSTNYNWRDKVYYTFFNYDTESQASYGLLDMRASLGLRSDKLTLSLFAKNVTNQKYIQNAINVPWPTAANPANPEGTAIVLGTPGMPRTYGGTIQYRF